MQSLNHTLDAIPDYQAFLTVEELDRSSRRLAEAYPNLVGLSTIGHSRDGHPILQLRIGQGSRSALLFGCPHPNEPIGAMMLEYLSWRLCEDAALRESLDYTFYLIKCIDVDGTRLNEGWFKGPFTPSHYARNFYRPAFHDQVEWTFPIAYKSYRFDRPLPETQALMRSIGETRPEFIFSLHNAGFGGVFFYVSHPLPEPLFQAMRDLAAERRLPLHRGEPEVPYAERLSDAVYRMPTARQMYDFYAAMMPEGDPAAMMAAGACSSEFAQPISDPLTLVAEMPYFYDPRVEDQSPTETLRREAVLASLDRDERLLRFLSEQYEKAQPHLVNPTRFELALADFLTQTAKSGGGRRQWAERNPELAKPATVAQLFDSEVQMLFYRLLYYGIFLRMLSAQPAQPALEEVRQAVDAEMDRWSRQLEANLQYSVVPIRDLVAVQLGSALLLLDHLQNR